MYSSGHFTHAHMGIPSILRARANVHSARAICPSCFVAPTLSENGICRFMPRVRTLPAPPPPPAVLESTSSHSHILGKWLCKDTQGALDRRLRLLLVGGPSD